MCALVLVLRSGNDVRKKAEKVKRGSIANVDDSYIPKGSGSHCSTPLTPDISISGILLEHSMLSKEKYSGCHLIPGSEKGNQDDMLRSEMLIAKEEVFNLGETVPAVQQKGDILDGK